MIIPVGDKTIELNAVDGNIGVLLSGGKDRDWDTLHID